MSKVCHRSPFFQTQMGLICLSGSCLRGAVLPGIGAALVIVGCLVGCSIPLGAPDPLSGFEGPYPVKMESVPLEDGSEMSVYYPDVETHSELYPVIIFSGGWNLARVSYHHTARRLAEWGYIAIIRFYPTVGIWSFGPVLTDVHIDQIKRIIDWCIVENSRLGSPLYGVVDTEHIGLMGHSFGAELSMMASTIDPRVDAVVSLDALYGDKETGFPQTGDPAAAPGAVMYIGASEGGYCSGRADRLEMLRLAVLGTIGLTILNSIDWDALNSDYFDLANLEQLETVQLEPLESLFEYGHPPTVEVVIKGAGHLDFIEQFVDQGAFGLLLCPKGSRDPAEVRAIARRYYTSWFNVHLKGLNEFDKYYHGEFSKEDEEAGLVTIRTNLNGEFSRPE